MIRLEFRAAIATAARRHSNARSIGVDVKGSKNSRPQQQLGDLIDKSRELDRPAIGRIARHLICVGRLSAIHFVETKAPPARAASGLRRADRDDDGQSPIRELPRDSAYPFLSRAVSVCASALPGPSRGVPLCQSGAFRRLDAGPKSRAFVEDNMTPESPAQQATTISDRAWKALEGAYDLQVHVGPDVIAVESTISTARRSSWRAA